MAGLKVCLISLAVLVFEVYAEQYSTEANGPRRPHFPTFPTLPTLPPILPPSVQCPKPGLCPYLRRHPVFLGVEGRAMERYEPPSLCGNLCIQDSTCSGTRKCCPTTCGYSCQEAVYIAN